MADHEDHRKYVPSWDGNPTGYKICKDAVRIWLLSEKLDVGFSLAARLVQNLTGSVRTLGNSMTDVELSTDPKPDVDGDEDVGVDKDDDGAKRVCWWISNDSADNGDRRHTCVRLCSLSTVVFRCCRLLYGVPLEKVSALLRVWASMMLSINVYSVN